MCTCLFNIVLVQNGLSPLYMASDKGHTEVVDILLKSGADPKLTTKVWGLEWLLHLLHQGCQWRYKSVITYLTKAG